MRRANLVDVLSQLAASSALCIIATAQPLLLELAKRGNDGKTPFHAPTAVFVTEVIKLVIALTTWLYQYSTLEYKGTENFRPVTSLAYAVPAILFAVQNNLVYIAMQDLDPPTFQLWACFKLIPVGIFSRILLGRRLTNVQWVALCLLALGMGNTTQACISLHLPLHGLPCPSMTCRGLPWPSMAFADRRGGARHGQHYTGIWCTARCRRGSPRRHLPTHAARHHHTCHQRLLLWDLDVH